MFPVVVLLAVPSRASEIKSDFFLSCEGLPVWQVAQAVSDYFKVNLLVFDDIKDRKIYGDINGLTLEAVLDSVSWFLGVEWIQKDNIYYLGGNADKIVVYNSSGINDKIEAIFEKGVKLIEDKIVVSGTEREVKRISDSLESIVKRDYINVRLYAFELSYDASNKAGIDWDIETSGSSDFGNLLTSGKGRKFFVQPQNDLNLLISADVQLDNSSVDIQTIIDTDLGILSGSETSFTVGDANDRELYTVSNEGSSVVSGFNTQESGIIVIVKAYKADKWFFNVQLEDSTAESDLSKSRTKISNNVVLDVGDTVLLGHLIKGTETRTITLGVPFLADIPYLGYLFRVTTDRTLRKEVFFFISYPSANPPPGKLWNNFGGGLG